MGNMHFVTQVEPKVHKNGAVIKVIQGKERLFRNKYAKLPKDKAVISASKIDIRCPNINESPNIYTEELARLYLVIPSGSKYGYQDGLRKILKELSKYLEDALFYIEDECAQYVEKFEIKQGAFINKLVIKSDGNLIDYYEKNYPKKKNTLFELMRQELVDLSEYPEWCFRKIISMANKALKINKNDWSLFHFKGIGQVYAKRYKSGISSLKRALKLKKEKIGKENEDLDTRRIYSSIAYAFNLQDKYEEAIEYCEIANKISPHFGELQPEEYMGYAYLNLKQYEKALEVFDRILKLAPKSNFISHALYNKACTLVGLGKFDQASGYMSAAISINPHSFPRQIITDPDLKPLLNYRGFKRLMGDNYRLLEEAGFSSKTNKK